MRNGLSIKRFIEVTAISSFVIFSANAPAKLKEMFLNVNKIFKDLGTVKFYAHLKGLSSNMASNIKGI